MKIPSKIIESINPFLKEFKKESSCIGICSIPRSASSLLYLSIVINYIIQKNPSYQFYYYNPKNGLCDFVNRNIPFCKVDDKFIFHAHFDVFKFLSFDKKVIYVDVKNEKMERDHQIASLIFANLTGTFNNMKENYNPFNMPEDEYFDMIKRIDLSNVYKDTSLFLNRMRKDMINYFRKNKMKILKVTKSDILNDWENTLDCCMKFLFNMNSICYDKYLKKLDDKKYIDFIIEHI